MGLGFIGDIRHIYALIINSLLLSKGETENLEENVVSQLLKEAMNSENDESENMEFQLTSR